MQSVAAGNVAIFRVAGLDSSNATRAITGSLSVSDYNLAYVAKNPLTENQFVFVAKQPSAVPGLSQPVSVTVAAKDAAGADLPPLVIDFEIPGLPLPPNATHVSVVEGPFVRDQVGYTAPPDPGSASIPL